ncbi:MAG: UvrD-helicase domain-containing protein [Acidobacteria bacterium]|nr:UvrD-helicase domain-containing protein [Acidobacteriota bacterium]
MTGMRLKDRKDRDRIQRDLAVTFLVEAGAGSGKTHSLVERMIALLRSGACGIETLAAVTFTRKAAAELQERFQTTLERAYVEVRETKEKEPGNKKAEEEWDRLGHSLRNLEQGFIGTIHSFCGRILRERPVEAGLMPDFREMDDVEDAVYQENGWLEYINRVRHDRPPELAALEEVGIVPEDLREAFETACMFPEVRMAGGREDPPAYDRLRKKLETLMDDLGKKVPLREQSEDRDGIMNLAAVLFVRRRNLGFDDPLVLMETLEGLDRSGFTPTLKLWPDSDTAKKVEADLESFRDDVVRPGLVHWREYRHSRVLRFLKPAVEFYAERRRNRSLVNFTDLLMGVANLLRDNADVRAYFQKKFTHILVDEFQDTDPIQAEVLFFLTGEDHEEKDWRKIIPRPGSLFLVGDPKQSIYRFRRADIDTYNLVRGLISDGDIDKGYGKELSGGQSGTSGGKNRKDEGRRCGEVLRLKSNFRSLHSLARFNNKIFKPVFPPYHNAERDMDVLRLQSFKGEKEESFFSLKADGDPRDYQADFVPLITVRPDVEGAESGVFKITIEKKKWNNQEEIAADDSARIADWIQWAWNGNVRLACTEDELDAYVEQETKRGRSPEEEIWWVETENSKQMIPLVPSRPADFLILFRYKKKMNAYARALEMRGIPYEISGSSAFAEERNIAEIFNLARALQDPDNPVYTLAVLRGIFFGLPDDRLFQWKRHVEGKNPFSFTRWRGRKRRGPGRGAEELNDEDRVPDEINGPGDEESSEIELLPNDLPDDLHHVAWCLSQMYTWWRWTKDEPPTAALEKIFEDAGLIPYLAGGELGSSRAGNVFKLLAYLRAREKDGVTDFSAMVDFMDELTDLRAVEEMSLLPGQGNAVRLMNIHKAKGLEAPVVFLANPKGTKDFPQDRHVVRAESIDGVLEEGRSKPKGYFVFSRKKGEFQRTIISQPVDWAEFEGEEQKYDDAEVDRLMYVAATRARNMMVVSTYDGNLSNKSWPLIDDNLQMKMVKELKDPSGIGSGNGDKKPLVLTLDEVRRARESIQARLEEAGRESYAVRSVTALSKEEGEAPFRGETGRGMRWGRMIHGILEAAGRDGEADLELLAENALLSEDWDLSEKRALVEHVKGILASEFWGRMKAAEEKFFEVPFALRMTAGELDLAKKGKSGDHGDGKQKQTKKGKSGAVKEADPDLPVIINGVIDLVFKEGGEWVIVDYKTDEIGRDSVSMQSLVDYYTPQVRLYTRFWEKITGEPVKETALYFTSVGKWVNIKQV